MPSKIIIVEKCDTCPFYGTCKAWTDLNSTQRIQLTLSPKYRNFILSDCHLKDYPEKEIEK